MLATTAAHSQGVPFSEVDRDGNGVLSYDELVLTFGTASANQLWERNGGRDISPDDIRRINASRDDDDDDGFDDDDDDDDDDDGRSSNDNDDDDDDDDDDDGRSSNDDDDDDDDDGGNDDDD
ncbi:EF-hand domain-containing protein [Yoonia sp.]|uniref:EF-hand domain-containing protein n=1 Tax=Yoonia sp. TaxID=2212373 RepID=UPI002FDADE74